MYALRLTSDDIARVRFAVSPLWEVCHAVRALVDTRQHPYHLPWLDQVRPQVADLDVLPLLAIQPLTGYTPDLIAPVPEHPRATAAEQLAQVRSTPLRHVETELRRAFTERGNQPVPAQVAGLAERPREARARIADALEACWEVMVAPYWPRINDLLTADIAHHSRLLADHGLERLFPSISPALSWRDRTLLVDAGPRSMERRPSRGRGLLLQPSAFGWPRVFAVIDEPYQPAVVYPARGVAELWQPAEESIDAHLATLLGGTRAKLLASVREPASTTTLARRHDLAPATVSQHLAALSGSRLVTSRRNGREVFYRTTELGDALLSPEPGHPRQPAHAS